MIDQRKGDCKRFLMIPSIGGTSVFVMQLACDSCCAIASPTTTISPSKTFLTLLNRSAKDTGTQTSSFGPFQRKLSATNLGLTNVVYKERYKTLSIKTLIHFLLSSSFCQNRFNCSRESAIGNTSAVDAEAKLLDIMQSDFLALLGAFKLVVVTVLLILICQGFLFQGFVNKHAL